MENCQVKPKLQTVRLHSSRVFISQRCPNVAIMPQGPPKRTESMKKLSLDKTHMTKPNGAVLTALHRPSLKLRQE